MLGHYTSAMKYCIHHRMVHVVTTYLQNNEIAHNMFITRGDVFGEENCGTPHRTVRIYVWPRKTVTGKTHLLADHVILYSLNLS